MSKLVFKQLNFNMKTTINHCRVILRYITIGFFITVSLFLFSATIVSAQNGLIPCTGVDCDACHFVDLGNSLLNWLIGVLMVIFAIIAVSAGFKLVTSAGNIQAKSDAKNKLVSAIIGLIIVLAAWLLIDTIMRGLLNSEEGEITGFGPWSEIRCGVSYLGETAVESLGSLTTPSGTGPYGNGGSILSEADALSQLAAAGLGDGGNVISYEGLRQNTINQIVAMNSDCGCDIVITEATGGTHALGVYSHENGYKLDLRTKDNPELVQYVEDNFDLIGQTYLGKDIYQRSDDTGGYQKCIFHDTHLDCQFVPGASTGMDPDIDSGSGSGSAVITCGPRPQNVAVVDAGVLGGQYNQTRFDTAVPNGIYAFKIVVPTSGVVSGDFRATITSASSGGKLVTVSSCPGDYTNPVDSRFCSKYSTESSRLYLTSDPNADRWCVLQAGKTYYANVVSRESITSSVPNCSNSATCSFYAAMQSQ